MNRAISEPAEPYSFDESLYKKIRIVDDFYLRSRPGPIFYTIAILVSALSDQMYSYYLPEVLTATLFFSIVAIIRLALKKPEANLVAIEKWEKYNWSLIFLSSISWGTYFGWVMSVDALTNTMQVLLLATISFSIACSFWFCINRTLCQCACLLFVFPSIIAIFFSRPDQYPLAIGIISLAIFLIIATIRNNKAYHQQLNNEVELYKTQQELTKLSLTDELTDLANRREYNSFMEQAFNTARRNVSKLSLILMDIDHFKHINDKFGHATGDLCLQHIANILKTHGKRDTDLIARMGGEEFSLVLPDTNLANAKVLASTIHRAIYSTPFIDANREIKITSSFGVGEFNNNHDKSSDDLYRRVDNATYQAKTNGRNTIEEALSTEIDNNEKKPTGVY